jgi:hypothetical protein
MLDFSSSHIFLFPPLLQFSALRPQNVGTYDLILTAETVYSTAAAHSLAGAIGRLLAPGRASAAVVAAKAYYFGVGGGIDAFQEAAEACGLSVDRTRARIEDGRSNVREIVIVRRAE